MILEKYFALKAWSSRRTVNGLRFDMVPGETETRDRRADYIGRVCVIGVDLDKEALQKVFG